MRDKRFGKRQFRSAPREISRVFIGAPEADSAEFARRARADFPGIDLFASNDRAEALAHAADASALIGHHFQFDEDLLARAAKLRWIQSLTTGTYSQPSRTCSNVSCHKSQTAVVNGSPFRPELTIECNACHQY